MAYKEKVQNEIKKDNLKNLWEKICESYEQGGKEQITSILNCCLSRDLTPHLQIKVTP